MSGKESLDFHALLRPGGTVLLILDYQARLVARLSAGLRESLSNNILALAKLARSCEVPVVLSNLSLDAAVDKAGDRLKEYLPSEAEMHRSTLNCWEDPAVYQGIEGFRRRRLLVAGLWTETAVSFAALSALELGYDVYAVTDAMAGLTASPAFSTSEFHIVTGLLLPIWDRLPADNMRVYRLQTDDGERVIGRLVTPEALDAVYAALGIDADHNLSADDIWAAVMERGSSIALAGGLNLRRARVMHVDRFEVAGFAAGAVDQLKALGLGSEIITWKLRLFVPITDDGVAILSRLLDRHPVLHCTARARP